MKIKKQPERRCIACNEKVEKKQLLRIVRTPEKNIFTDANGENFIEYSMEKENFILDTDKKYYYNESWH